MCGICGFNWEDKELVRRMADSMKHRGPDDHGYYTDKNISLGHRRLSIIDLSKAGHQPMSNEEGTIWITYNGEIYNYKEIREELLQKGHTFKSNSDTEVIIHAYEEYGHNCVKKFRGMFAFAIWDSKRKELFMARDQIGIKPLYYYHKKSTGEFIFASEIKAILEWDGYKKKPNKKAIGKYLTFHYTPDEESCFEGIHKLPASHYLILKEGGIEKTQYYEIRESIERGSEKHFLKKLETVLDKSVQDHMIADVEVGSFLSGGVDSSLITAMAQKHMDRPINTFSVGFDYFSEMKFSKKVSEHIGTEHHPVYIEEKRVIKELPKMMWHFDEPMSEGGCIPNYIISEEARKKVKVVLAGEGGDEIFAGYGWYKYLTFLKRSYKLAPHFFRKNLYAIINRMKPGKKRRALELLETAHNSEASYLKTNGVFNRSEIMGLLNYEYDYDESLKVVRNNLLNERIKKPLNKLLFNDIKVLLAECFLMKADKMTMAHSLEERVPIIYPSIVDLAFTMRPNLKIKVLKEKYILKKLAERYLPKEITKRKKQGYGTPIYAWMNGELGAINIQAIEKARIAKEGYIKQEKINEYIRRMKKEAHIANKVWTLYALEEWFKMYDFS